MSSFKYRNASSNTSGTTAIFSPDLSDVSQDSSVDYILERFVRNTGNIFFWKAPQYLINHDAILTDWDFDRSDVETLVLSMGNWISGNVDMADFNAALERSKAKRIVMIGAGIQAQSSLDEVVVNKTARRLLDIVRERSTSIGVRGFSTRCLLEKHGYKNVRAVGCPSIYLIEPEIFQKKKIFKGKISVNTTWHGHYRDAIAELLAFGSRYDAMLVEQSNRAIMQLAQNGTQNRDFDHLTKYYSFGPDNTWKIISWLTDKAAFYTGEEDWSSALDSCQLVIGSRFHGAVAALRTGTRALMLTMDLRTKELTEFFNLPSQSFETFDAEKSPQYYFDQADPYLFLSTLSSRKLEFSEFLKENGLNLSDQFSDAIFDREESLHEKDGELDFCENQLEQFARDLESIYIQPRQIVLETARRLAKPRDPLTGSEIEKAEFIYPYTMRDQLEQNSSRVTWRKRQGVKEQYIHQPSPVPYDDRDETDSWQREVYLNALSIARSNNLSKIVDFGCGSGYKLMKYFEEFETVGIEIDPALTHLRQTLPERKWLDGTVIHPDLFEGDLVVCADVLEHLLEPDYLLRAFSASNAPVFVLSTPTVELLSERGISPRWGPPSNPSHVFEWSSSEFFSLISDHLDVVAHSIVNLKQGTQMCIAVPKSRRAPPVTLPTISTSL